MCVAVRLLALAMIVAGVAKIAGIVIGAVFWPALAILAGYCVLAPYLHRRI